MSRKGRAVLAILGLVAVAGLMVGCNGFFVSPNSVASVTVSPPAAVLSSASGAGTLQMSAQTVLVNQNSSDCTSSGTWTTSDTAGTILTVGPSTGLVTPVGGGQATVTVTCNGTSSAAVPIDVITAPLSGNLTVNLSGTTVTPPGSVTVSVVTTTAQTIPSQFVTWSIPTGTSISGSGSSATVTFGLTVTAGTTATITATVTTNGGATLTGTSQSITVL
jgi:hypothetical protein